MEDLKPLGVRDGAKLAGGPLGSMPRRSKGYGKGSIVGTGERLEHGALWHARAAAMRCRDVLGGFPPPPPPEKGRLCRPRKKVGAAGVRPRCTRHRPC